MHHDCLSRLM